MPTMLFSFIGGTDGPWIVQSLDTVAGAGLERPERLLILREEFPASGDLPALPPGVRWRFRGTVSNLRYTQAEEKADLARSQPALGRPEAVRAALILIRKTEAWWDLPQDERRRIFEESSAHIRIGLRYLPAVARRLHHSRDLGEPFDFLTWFEFAPSDGGAFEDLLGELRRTPEWAFVEREVDLRLERA